MEFYCGIDVSARTSVICVIDEQLKILVRERVSNNIGEIVAVLKPYRNSMQIVVESTFNWYWLVDGLQAEGFTVFLAHTLGLSMITKAKVKTDPRDAFALAKLLRIGVIPKSYIYPAALRPVRDLLRKRNSLVNSRAIEYGSLRALLLRYGFLDHSRQSVKTDPDEEILRWLEHPLVKLHAHQELERIRLLSQQIALLDSLILGQTKQCPDFVRLRTIPGIGAVIALTIFYETGDLSRFADARNFSSYCRVVPGISQSGSTIRRGRGSKQGNVHLKWAFSQAALHAVRCFPKVKRCYERHLKRHKGRAGKLIAYNVIAHKLALAVYHVLKNKTAYKEELLFGS